MKPPRDPMAGKRTECLEILKLARLGLDLPKDAYLAVHYTSYGLQAIFRFTDDKTYRILIEELPPKAEAAPNEQREEI